MENKSEELVQLHTRVKASTKEAIWKIARERRCQIGAVIDEAIRQLLKRRES